MKIRNTFFLVITAGIVYVLSIAGSSCAQIGAPTGGPRDSLPPKLLNASPPNHTIHFKRKKITLTFNEYVQIQNMRENLLVSPTPEITPNINYKLKTVTIELRDTLEPNTTYRLQLGNAIQDINENNPYPDFTYVFSTGAYIDSLTYAGHVQLAQTGKIDSTLLVLLYADLSDSAVYKTKPKYITRLDSSGKFLFKNLAEGVYNIFALEDEGGQKKYTSDKQLFAFADSTVKVATITDTTRLYAYAEEEEIQKTTKSTNKKATEKQKLEYNTSLSNGSQDLLSPLTITFNATLKDFDSTKIRLSDTLYAPLEPAIISIDTLFKTVTVRYNWEGSAYYKLIIDKEFGTDTLGVALEKSDTLSFRGKNESDYGTIKINFINLEKFTHPVVQFISGNKVVKSYPLISPTIVQRLFDPGEFELRILNDINQNGVWDPGNYDPVNPELQKQPEIVYSVVKTIKVRANWENEWDIVL